MLLELTDTEVQTLLRLTRAKKYTGLHAKLREENGRRENLAAAQKRFADGRARIERLKQEPPPPGYAYRCTVCGQGTNAPSRECLPCAVL